MVKAYSSTDNTFTGSNTFSSDLDMDNNKVDHLDTPTVDTDASTKKYVDDIEVGIATSNYGTFSYSSDTTGNMDTLSVSVASGQVVLLLSNGRININGGDDAQIWFRRGTTDLTNTAQSLINLGVDGTQDFTVFNWSMQYMDTTPGTGTVEYHVRGWTDNTIRGEFTAIVLDS